MIDILKNNLHTFNTNDKNANTIICDASEIETSMIFNTLTPLQKSHIHLNIKMSSDKDIEHLIYIDTNNQYKSVNIIINSDFNLSKIACEKLSIFVNINSVLKITEDNKIKGYSFKNYFLTDPITQNEDTNLLLTNDTLYTLKNHSTVDDQNIVFDNIEILSTEIIDFLKSKNFNKILFKIDSDIFLDFKCDLLYTIFERIKNYTNSININIEDTHKFNIAYKKILNDINEDFKNKELYDELTFSGYHFITYQTLRILNFNTKFVMGKSLDSNIDSYYIQINLDKYWFNLDIIWNYKYLTNDNILQSDKEFFKTHSTKHIDINKCTISYKKFYKRYTFLRVIKNKFLFIFGKNKKELLGLPAPKVQNTNNSIFERSM